MSRFIRSALLLSSLIPQVGVAQRADVTLRVRFRGAPVVLSAETPVVVWLTPLDGSTLPVRGTQTFRMEQKNRKFAPHLLVVRVGNTVEFPNLDPFFHNVFSLFNGRRFDLGLYETGKSQAVKLQREGVSYIFCNIHPEMGGIILSLATPYFVSSETGDVVLRSLPPGAYKLGIWTERATVESLNAAAKTINIGTTSVDMGVITLEAAPRSDHKHQNKYGDEYPAQKE